ncbi:MAG: IS6 family transposase [Deltaproteobacteria bacterium]|nr:IS6 family transposase [Deltaproteobacteria bacterium]
MHSNSAFSGYRWPADVILTAVRWYCSYPLSANHVMQLLAEPHIDVSARTVLTWVQTFGPRLAAAARPYRRHLGRRWWVDEVFCCHGQQKRYLYRAIDQPGYQPTKASRHETTRAVMAAMTLLGARLKKAA